jgi:hypothetical protein
MVVSKIISLEKNPARKGKAFIDNREIAIGSMFDGRVFIVWSLSKKWRCFWARIINPTLMNNKALNIA